jgi:predicted permease
MAAITIREATHALSKRSNWAGKEAGVIVVFCVVFIVASGLIGLYLSRFISRKRAEKAASRSTV